MRFPHGAVSWGHFVKGSLFQLPGRGAGDKDLGCPRIVPGGHGPAILVPAILGTLRFLDMSVLELK